MILIISSSYQSPIQANSKKASASSLITSLFSLPFTDKQFIAGQSTGEISVFNRNTLQEIISATKHASAVTALTFAQDAVFSGDSTGEIRSWSLTNTADLTQKDIKPTIHSAKVTSIAAIKKNNKYYVASGSSETEKIKIREYSSDLLTSIDQWNPSLNSNSKPTFIGVITYTDTSGSQDFFAVGSSNGNVAVFGTDSETQKASFSDVGSQVGKITVHKIDSVSSSTFSISQIKDSVSIDGVSSNFKVFVKNFNNYIYIAAADDKKIRFYSFDKSTEKFNGPSSNTVDFASDFKQAASDVLFDVSGNAQYVAIVQEGANQKDAIFWDVFNGNNKYTDKYYTECGTGYYKNSVTGLCLQCSSSANCFTCVDQSDKCQSCVDGYLLVQAPFYKCMKIVECPNSVNYKLEVVSFSYYNGDTKVDNTDKKKCSRSGKCATQFSTYYNSTTQKCEQCNPGCSECFGSGPNDCNLCYTLSINTPPNKISDLKCCSKGYYAENNSSTCVECNSMLNGCGECMYSTTDSKPICTGCQDYTFFQLNSETSADKCIPKTDKFNLLVGKSSGSKKKKLSGGAIAGIVIGCLIFAGASGYGGYYLWQKKTHTIGQKAQVKKPKTTGKGQQQVLSKIDQSDKNINPPIMYQQSSQGILPNISNANKLGQF